MEPQVYPQTKGVGLRWTGNYMMDMAVAGLIVFAEKEEPEQLVAEDLRKFQMWAERMYFAPDLKAWIHVVFTLNGFMNTNKKFTDSDRRAKLTELLTSFERPNMLDVPCAFYPELLAQQRVARDLLPMLMGRSPMNFYPDGQPGLPLSGLAITALQGLSLAVPLVSGRALLVDADDPLLLLKLVEVWHKKLMARAELSFRTNNRLDIWVSARTRLIEAIREVMSQRHIVGRSVKNISGSVTLYHLINGGTEPDIQVYALQQPVIRFLENAERKFKTEWNTLVHSALHSADKGKDAQYGTRNDLDEALFSLPGGAHSFIRRFLNPVFRDVAFPPEPKQLKGKKTTGITVSTRMQVPLKLGRVWSLTTLFLMEVVGMEKERIAAIETLGTSLGNWIVEENDKPLFRSLYRVFGAGPMRHLLLKTSFEKAKQDAEKGLPKDQHPLLITPELYLKVFMEADEIVRADFTLARDLLKMRVLQVLHEADFFNRNKGDPELEQAGLNDEGANE